MGRPEDYAAFAELMARCEPPLDRALAAIAATSRTDVDPESIIARLDDLAGRCTAGQPGELCGELFEPGRPGTFLGDRERYYDIENSLLDEVLERRRGIPITLAVVAIEVGRRRGVGLVGVGMPGHFLVRAEHDTDAYFDVFDGGRPLDASGCRQLFRELHGPGPEFSEAFLEPTPNTQIVARVLNNLMGAARRAGDRPTLTCALRLSAALPHSSIASRVRLAGSLAAAGRFGEAATVYEELAALDPDGADEHAAAALGLRARLN